MYTRVSKMNTAEIKQKLGEPYFETENCLIYNDDSLKLMKKFDDNTVDMTVTSPPYNIGKEYETLLPIDDYLNWCEKWINEIYRITKMNGTFWLNLGYLEMPNKAKALPIPYLLWERNPFYFIQEIVWNYGAGVSAKKFFAPRNEKLLWYVKDKDNYTFNLDDIRDKNVKIPKSEKKGKIKM